MKKIMFFIMIAAIIVNCFPAAAFAEILPESRDAVFLFSSNLKTVEEEAFSGTALKTAVFSEGFLHLDNRAFDNTSFFQNVYFPQTTLYIADTALPVGNDFSVHAEIESYAQTWAKAHGVKFIAVFLCDLALRDGYELIICNLKKDFVYLKADCEKTIVYIFEATAADKSMRPQDRPELNPIDYKFP